VCSKQTGEMLGQAVGGGPYGAHNGPQRVTFLVDLREPIQSRWPRTLWPQLLDDLLRKRRLLEEKVCLPFKGISRFFGQSPISRGPEKGRDFLIVVRGVEDHRRVALVCMDYCEVDVGAKGP
jgi:hypothetical protein